MPQGQPEPHTRYRYSPGQLVRHRRYGYRGVIFDADSTCSAPDAWYQNNQTQPPRDQPWYHVLVHGALHTTYVAESNLLPDQNPQPVQHPELPRHFQSFDGERYHKENLN